MMSDCAVSPLKQDSSAAMSGPPPAPEPVTSHSYDPPTRVHIPLSSEGATAGTSNQQPSVRPKLSTQFPRSPSQQLQYHTPVRQFADPGLCTQITPAPPVLSPYTDLCAASALMSPATPSAAQPMSQPAVQDTMASALLPQASMGRPPTSLPPQAMQQPTMNHSGRYPYPTQVYQPSPQVPTSYADPPQLHISQATAHHSQIPVYSSANSAWAPTAAMPNPLNMTHAAFDHTASPHAHAPVHLHPSASAPQVSVYPQAVPQHTLLPPAGTQHIHMPLNAPVRATAIPSLPPAAYGGFLQTHQVKNVQVFTGNADSKMLVEDWIRDMQYLLEAIELPLQLRFSTVVRHLSGEARKLVLNLPPHDQTPEKAFEELRAEYGDTQGSLDPLADFYERGQRSGESACSYAIALEATLRAVEDSQRGGKPFPDRDCKLTRQFLRGLNDEEVYMRIAPMKPRLLSFRELQAELRNLIKETKKFQSLNKSKRTYTQVQVTPDCNSNVKAEKAKHTSEWSELTALVKKLALCQEEQMAKLTRLESRMAAPSSVPPPTVRPSPGPTIQTPVVTCYRCGKLGHIARVCRAVFPDPHQAQAPQPHSMTYPEGNTLHSAQSLNE